MINPFLRALPIWVDNFDFSQMNNQYVEFFTTFDCIRFTGDENNKPQGNVILNINVDNEFVVWINGKFVFTGQHSQFPGKPAIETMDVSSFILPGRNTISVLAYHQGFTTSQYYKDTPRLIFEITQKESNEINGATLCSSGEKTLSRISPFYQSGDVPFVAGQLGYTFSFINSKNDQIDYRSSLFNDEDAKESGFTPSVIAADISTYKFQSRNIKKLEMIDAPKPKIVAQGLFDYGAPYREKAEKKIAEYMQDAALKSRYLKQVTEDGENKELDNVKNYISNFDNVVTSVSKGTHFHTNELQLQGALREGKGIYVVIDLQKETFGYLSFDVIVKRDTIIGVSYSDHLDDLRARAFVGGRSFAATLTLSKGETAYTHFMQKIGARYIQIYAETNDIIIKSFGILPVSYPFEKSQLGVFKINDALHMKIYETALDTLKLCMSEHYMDCPQREQSLYAMDSRNQMLCGYYAFGEYKYAKESLRIMAESLREDGLLELCSPGQVSITIPSFSIYFVIAICEYAKYSGDVEFVKSQSNVINNILKATYKRINETLAITMFEGQQYWNFHEWGGEISGGIQREDAPDADALLTALYIIALDSYSDTIIQNFQDDKLSINRASQLKQLASRMREMYNENFFDEKVNAYYSYNSNGKLHDISEFTNALAILCGAAKLDNDVLASTILTLKGENPLCKANPCTLSTTIFKYEALLTLDEKNIDFVMHEIEKLWGYMLYHNATSFWETIQGGEAFDDAGSLCHGWSSIPVIIYYKYILGISPKLPGFKEYDIKPISYDGHKAYGEVYSVNGKITAKM